MSKRKAFTALVLVIGAGISFLAEAAEHNKLRSPAEVKFEKTKRILLWIGIFIMPYIFAWFTLSKTFTKNNRIIAFGWMLFVIILMLSGKN